MSTLADWLHWKLVRVHEGRVQVLRMERCGSCGHRHVDFGNGRCRDAIAALCSCCPQTWPEVADVEAASA